MYVVPILIVINVCGTTIIIASLLFTHWSDNLANHQLNSKIYRHVGKVNCQRPFTNI